jgi:hypothetical protein
LYDFAEEEVEYILGEDNEKIIVKIGRQSDDKSILVWCEPRTNSIVVYPTNQSHVVICAAATENASYHDVYDTTRGWWYVDYEAGIPTTYFTNLFHAWQSNNWTNYYEALRSGATLNSNRVKEDTYMETYFYLIREAALEQLEYLYQDPLFPALNRYQVKNFIDHYKQKGQP